MDTTLRPGSSTAAIAGARPGATAPARPAPLRDSAAADTASAVTARAPVRHGRGLRNWDTGLQREVARAQQALDYLNRVEAQLEALKSALAAKLSGNRTGSAELGGRARQMASTLAARNARAGGGVDARLDYRPGQAAQQRFQIAGLDVAALQQGAPLTLAFSVGGVGGPQLSATFEPGMDAEQIAARLDRTLAPVHVRAALDEDGELVFSTDESNWSAVRDSFAISGRGLAPAEPLPDELQLEGIENSDAEALHQSLREVVQALERVRRSQAAASNALSAAAANTAELEPMQVDMTLAAQDFATTASSHHYDSLLALTSALIGVSRERVLALLGLR